MSGLRVLFVCTANICRSAYAEAYARATAPAIRVASAGTHGLAGAPMDPAMVRQLTARGIAEPTFRSRPVTPADVAAADLVLTMESAHRTFLLDEQPEAMGRIFTLGHFVERAAEHPDLHGATLVDELGARRTRSPRRLDVRDPYGRGDAAAAATAERIGALVDGVLAALG